MTRLWCIRHGQTIWNLEERYNGLSDIPLNPVGVERAEALSKQLAGNGVVYRAIYSSHLQRARQTAGIINKRQDLPAFVDERLREIELGAWEGKTFREIDISYPQEIAQRASNAAVVRAPGGESALEVAQRMAAAANDIVTVLSGGGCTCGCTRRIPGSAYPYGSRTIPGGGLPQPSRAFRARNRGMGPVQADCGER